MQIINVDLIPGKVMPILHASQFDKGRSLGVKLYNGGAVFELSGAETLTAAVRKPDGNIVTETLTNAGGSLVEIITTEQMTACAGCSLCEIKIENAGDVIGTANFVLDVEEDPTNGGIESESEINNLATQVAQLVSEQYDSGNVIFDNEPTEGHGNGYTVTSEGIKAALDAINNPDASAVNYDNTDSGLTADNVQDAIDEVNDKADTNATNIGDLTALTTTDKSSLVGAVNEVNKYETDDYNIATYGGIIRCKKWGRIVNVQGYGIGSTTQCPTGAAYTFATIAEKYRPNPQQHIMGFATASSYKYDGGQGYRINTDGTIVAYVYAGTNLNNGYFNVTYMV